MKAPDQYETVRDLIASRDALRVDAERYRWLRAQTWDRGPLAVVRNPKQAIKLGYDAPSRLRLDEAIDEAMKEPR